MAARQLQRLCGAQISAEEIRLLAKQLGHLAKAAAQTLESDPARPVVVIADGAVWIKQEQGRHLPQATCILDWAHLWREVRHALLTAARAKGLSTSARDYQLFWHRTHLWQGNVEPALEGLRRLSTDLPAEALKPVREAIGYLEHQRPWMSSSEHCKAQGYPVGSGMIERAVAIVINRPMKKRGMRWCRATRRPSPPCAPTCSMTIGLHLSGCGPSPKPALGFW